MSLMRKSRNEMLRDPVVNCPRDIDCTCQREVTIYVEGGGVYINDPFDAREVVYQICKKDENHPPIHVSYA